MVANPWLFFFLLSFFLLFCLFVVVAVCVFCFPSFIPLLPPLVFLNYFFKTFMRVYLNQFICLLACLWLFLFFLPKNEKFWSWHSVSPCVAANGCFTQTRFNCSCNQFLEETLRVFLQSHIDWSMHGQAILFLGWNSEGVFCSYTLIDGQIVYCPWLVETEASAHWSVHDQAVYVPWWKLWGCFCSYTLIDGQAVLSLTGRNFEANAHWSIHGQAVILSGNSEGVFAVTHWLMVKLRCP